MKRKAEETNLIDKYNLVVGVIPGSAVCGRVMYEWGAVLHNTPICGGRQYVGRDGAMAAALKFLNQVEVQNEG